MRLLFIQSYIVSTSGEKKVVQQDWKQIRKQNEQGREISTQLIPNFLIGLT